MSTLLHKKTTTTVQAREVSFAGDRLCIELSDGRELRVPYKKFPGLAGLPRPLPGSEPTGRLNPVVTRFTGSNWMTGWKSAAGWALNA